MSEAASESESVGDDDRFVINPLYMFRWEETQDAYVLLYPEGVVKLNSSAAEILKRCSGEMSVVELVRDIAGVFSADTPKDQIETGVRKFLAVAEEKGWIRRQC